MPKKESLAYSIGVYMAKYIIHTQMPSLSHEAWTNNIIQVTWGEAEEVRRLEREWYSKRSSEEIRILKENPGLSPAERYSKKQEAHKLSEDEWNALMKYRYEMKEKYLPHTVTFNMPYVDFSDEETNKQIKKGFINTMWDSDHCDYSLNEEDITFENEEDRYGPDDKYKFTFTNVTMKLGLEPPSSYTGEEWIEIKTPQNKKNGRG